jgi:hypothetical protein
MGAPNPNSVPYRHGRAHGFWLDYQHLRLAVEPHQNGWQVFVYDRIARLIRYRAQRMTSHCPKVAAVEYSVLHLGDPENRQDPEQIAEGLGWKLIGRAGIQ